MLTEGQNFKGINMKKLPVVGILGTNGSVLLSELGNEAAMEEVGKNTGNLLFQYSSSKNILNPKLNFSNSNVRFDILKNNIDVLVIPAANQLNPKWDLSWWATIIEKLDKPVVIAGLGAQAKIGEISSIRLPEGTVRFLHLLKERAVYVGMRGQGALQVADKYGLHNAIVSGCPSNFINPVITGASIQSRLDKLATKKSLIVNRLVGTLEEYTREAERALFGLLSENMGRYIYQTNISDLNFISSHENEEDLNFIDWEANIIAPGLERAEYKRKLKHRGQYFFSAPAWIDEAGKADLNIGMRIHGAVAAIQGGGLGVCVAFDARTLELAETMGYPYVMAADVVAAKNLAELLRRVRFDPDLFDKKRNELRVSMKLCFEQFGVETAI